MSKCQKWLAVTVAQLIIVKLPLQAGQSKQTWEVQMLCALKDCHLEILKEKKRNCAYGILFLSLLANRATGISTSNCILECRSASLETGGLVKKQIWTDSRKDGIECLWVVHKQATLTLFISKKKKMLYICLLVSSPNYSQLQAFSLIVSFSCGYF